MGNHYSKDQKDIPRSTVTVVMLKYFPILDIAREEFLNGKNKTYEWRMKCKYIERAW